MIDMNEIKKQIEVYNESITCELDEIIDLHLEIDQETKNLNNQINATESNTLKKLLTDNYNLSENIIVRSVDMMNLFEKYFSTSTEISDILREQLELTFSVKQENELGAILNMRNKILAINEYTSLIDIHMIQEIIDLFILNTIKLFYYNFYFSFTFINYNKYEIIKGKIENLLVSVAELSEVMSSIIAIIKFPIKCAEIVNLLDGENYKEEFFEYTDKNLTKLEMQNRFLCKVFLQQNSILEMLQNLLDNAKRSKRNIEKKD